MFKKLFILTVAVVFTMIIINNLAFAAENSVDAAKQNATDKDMKIRQEVGRLAKISLVEATKIALSTVPGQVIQAGLENENNALIYRIEIVGADGKITDVKIDAGNSKILASNIEADEDNDGIPDTDNDNDDDVSDADGEDVDHQHEHEHE